MEDEYTDIVAGEPVTWHVIKTTNFGEILMTCRLSVEEVKMKKYKFVKDYPRYSVGDSCNEISFTVPFLNELKCGGYIEEVKKTLEERISNIILTANYSEREGLILQEMKSHYLSVFDQAIKDWDKQGRFDSKYISQREFVRKALEEGTE